jgi:hypothetical protein
VKFVDGLDKESDAWFKVDGEMVKVNDAYDLGIVSAQRYHDVSQQIIKDAQKITDEAISKQGIPAKGDLFNDLPATTQALGVTKNALQAMDLAAKNVSRDLANTFVGLITGAETFNQAIGNLLTKLAEMAAQSAIMKLLVGLIGGGNGWFGSIFGDLTTSLAGTRAGGGSVMGGSSYLVGENGPELFTPGASGSITPNGAGGNVYIDARGADGGIEYRVARAFAAMQRNTAKMAQLQMADAAARG